VASVRGSEVLAAELRSHGANEFIICLDVDFVITAIGQTNDVSALSEISSGSFDTHGALVQDTLSGISGVFVAGDLCSGNNMSVIGAIASGRKAANSVRRALENYRFGYEGEKALTKLNQGSYASATNGSTHREFVLPIAQGVLHAELSKYNLYQSCQKCNHCIDNFGCPALVKVDGKIHVDDARCTLCGLCIDVCPNNAIHWQVVEEKQVELVETM
jgi:heterodisulfide reductase subunit A-like polyferredoxin